MPRKYSSRLAVPAALLVCFCCTLIVYGLERHESLLLLSAYTLGFIACLLATTCATSDRTVYLLLAVAVLARLLLLPATPNLSDDVYRFIWDGRLWNQGIHPFAYLPSEIIHSALPEQLTGIDTKLYQLLNSPEYFTIYPPVNQLLFAFATFLFPDSIPGSVISIRLLLILAECLNLWLLYYLLQQAGWASRKVLLYALNPLVILELSGNLHFEALMLCFLLLSLLLLRRGQLTPAAICFGLAVCTKLIPLIFLPLYIRRLGFRRATYFYAITGTTTLLLFLPLLSRELLQGMADSIGLYFQKFEFNASIYYLVREAGFRTVGYNIIGSAGKWLAAATLLCIITFSWLERKKELAAAYAAVLLIYLLFATTVHPWYVIPLLAFSLFTSHRYAIVWSWAVFFSYVGYTASGYTENLLVTLLEYGLVLGVLGYELYQQYRKNLPDMA